MDPIVATAPADSGRALHRWASDLWPMKRSLTGDGVRETLLYLKRLLPELTIHEIESGRVVHDWTIPEEWNLNAAFVEDVTGKRIIDADENLLHVVGYSEPVDKWVSRVELESHLHSLPEQPDAIPFVTSYYSRTWGFCLRQSDRDALGPGPFRVVVDARLSPGALTLADLVIPGASKEEILFSTYVCHPNLANNELSGPVVAAALARWLARVPERRFTYRFVFAPETIGAVAYLAQHGEHLRRHVKAGWVLTCMGDERGYSYMPSRLGGTEADRISLRVLADRGAFAAYSFLERGSDERQWCSPGANLPVCSVMRTRYGDYPEYHTSLDDLNNVVTPAGLQGGLDVMVECVKLLEANRTWRALVTGEPQLGKRGLYPSISGKAGYPDTWVLLNVLTYCDGEHDIIAIADRTGLAWHEVVKALGTLEEHELVSPS